jgi:hypothetical protein
MFRETNRAEQTKRETALTHINIGFAVVLIQPTKPVLFLSLSFRREKETTQNEITTKQSQKRACRKR